MSDHPIIFSAPMVRALIEGRKTMTRRLAWRGPVTQFYPSSWQKVKPGDRLWVRECWAHYQTINQRRLANGGYSDEISDGLAGYRADGCDGIDEFRDHVRLMAGTDLIAVEINGDRWRSSIHMPRWASRLTLEVTAVKIERLQDISEEDALAEGVHELGGQMVGCFVAGQAMSGTTAEECFARLWEILHGTCSWEANPEVVALTFAVHKANIDKLGEPK